jgi:hypothetical protein
MAARPPAWIRWPFAVAHMAPTTRPAEHGAVEHRNRADHLILTPTASPSSTSSRIQAPMASRPPTRGAPTRRTGHPPLMRRVDDEENGGRWPTTLLCVW